MVRSSSLPLNTQQPGTAARQTASQPSPGQLRPPHQQRTAVTQQQSAPPTQPVVNQTPPQLPPRSNVADFLTGMCCHGKSGLHGQLSNLCIRQVNQRKSSQTNILIAVLPGGAAADPFQSSQPSSVSQNFANFDAFGLSSGGNVASTPTVPQFVVSGTVLQPENPNQPKPKSPPSKLEFKLLCSFANCNFSPLHIHLIQ